MFGHLKSVVSLVALVLAGCTSGMNLLESKPNLAAARNNTLTLPPAEAFVAAKNDPAEDQTDNIPVSEGVPSLTQLNSFVQPGIDPAKEAGVLEEQIQSAKVDAGIKWRGKMSDDGIDLANVNGVLCSSPTPAKAKTLTVQMACSDGRMATFKFRSDEKESKISFGNTVESVLLEIQ